MIKNVIVFIASCISLQGLAATNPVHNVQFSKSEILNHQQNIEIIISTASSCLDETYAEHIRFFNIHGVSKFYGDRRAQHKTRKGRIKELRRFGAPARLINQLEPISCIGLTLRCLGKGFHAAGTSATWTKIMSFLKIDQKVYGTDLQIMLQKLGWGIYYWNPKTKNNAKWDAEDKRLNPVKPPKKWNPVWGGHAYRYSTVMNKNKYYDTRVDNKVSLVNFGDKPPIALRQVPFFVGIAHAGYHVFPGRRGEVIEAHSTRPLNSIKNLEFSPFNPLGVGGGPRWTRTEKYRSGLIAIPPGE